MSEISYEVLLTSIAKLIILVVEYSIFIQFINNQLINITILVFKELGKF